MDPNLGLPTVSDACTPEDQLVGGTPNDQVVDQAVGVREILRRYVYSDGYYVSASIMSRCLLARFFLVFQITLSVSHFVVSLFFLFKADVM